MEKNLKRIRTIALLLIVILISVIAFGGLFIKQSGIWNNILPEFNLGMELSGIRELRFVLDTSEEEKEVYVDSEGNVCGEVLNNNGSNSNTEIDLVETTENQEEQNKEENAEDPTSGYNKETRKIKANEDANINIDNFEKAKKVIQNRLEESASYEYNIRLDNVTGELVIEVPDDNNVQTVQSLVSTVGNIEIIDYQNGLKLLDDSYLKNVSVTYGATEENKYQTYLILNFNEEGAEKLKKISTEYVAKKDENGTETKKYVTMKLDNKTLLQTYFGEELKNGTVQVPMGESTSDYNQFVQIYEQTVEIAKILNNEKMPLSYKLSSDNYINSFVNEDIVFKAKIVSLILIVLISLYLIIKFRLNGLKTAIITIGYIGLLIIIVKYTNVILTINSLIAFIGTIIINYVFSVKLLNKLNSGIDTKLAFGKTMKELYFTIIPICIIAIIFTFMHSTVISSIGMVLFWGIFVQALYNTLLIFVFDIMEEKKINK